jgi:thiol-disulfide isomerase/thioredoxin
MAQDQIKNPSGGNKPKPGTTSGGNGGQSAKDRSRALSRPVSGKAPAGSSGKASANKTGGNKPKPKPGGRPAATPAPRRVSGAMMAWGAVGLVVVIIVVLVVVKASSNSSNNTAYTPVTAAPASVVHDVTNIPESVYNTVGVNSPSVPVTPPTILSNQPPMTLDGKSPAMLYFGAEYCPYCAAERWAITAALSRFGTWSDLKITASSHTDVNPETHTFSFHGATLTSQYITFKGVEQYTNVPTSTPGAYTNLQNPTPQEKANILKYSSSKFNPNATSSGGVSFPYVNINNVALFSGASYSPGVLAGQTWDQIASGLSDPSNPATQAIVTTANYMSAAICASTDHAPASVCTSSGVKAAAKALKLG